MIGGAALLADGIITPPITVTSAIEGLRQLPALKDITQTSIIGIVIGIISLLFFVQHYWYNTLFSNNNNVHKYLIYFCIF